MTTKFQKVLSGAAATAALSAVSLSFAPAVFAASGNNAAITTTSSSQNKPLLVALGDSITFGYNLSDTKGNTVPSQSAFPLMIGQKDGFRVSNLGIPGWTSADLLNALSSANFDRAIASANVVSIDIGSNDLLHLSAPLIKAAQSNPGAPLTISPTQQQAFQNAIIAYSGNLAKIVGAVRKLTDAPILLYNMYDPFPAGTGLNTVTEQLETAENGIITQVAASVPNVTVVDAHQAFAGNQLTDVRVAQGDVHPTAVGQGVLAQSGENALLPNLAAVSKAKVSPLGATSLLSYAFPATGGGQSGLVAGNRVSFIVPSGSLNQGTEVDITSQPAATLASLAPKNTQVAAEVGVNFMSGVTFSSPYQITIQNSAITSGAAAYQVTPTGSLVAVPNAQVSSGKVVLSATAPGDFLILTPRTAAAVKGVTKPVTGLPFVEEGTFGFGLVAFGTGLLWLARRRRKEG